MNYTPGSRLLLQWPNGLASTVVVLPTPSYATADPDTVWVRFTDGVHPCSYDRAYLDGNAVPA